MSELPVAGTLQSIDWAAIAVPVTLAVGAVVVLLVDAFLGRRRLAGALTIVTAVVGAGFALGLANDLQGAGSAPSRATFCVPAGLERLTSCSYVVDSTTIAVWTVTLLGVLVVALLMLGRDDLAPPGEFHFLMLCSASGAATIAGARDLVTLVVALELVSLPAFAMVGLRRDNKPAAEAALKFFLISVVSTAVMLFGISLLYGITGSVYLDQIAVSLNQSSAKAVVGVGVVLTLVGLGFKVAAVPFHVWVPDTYVGASVPVAAYLSVVSKAAGLVGLIQVLRYGLWPYADTWGPILAVVAALTMTVGNVAALRQRDPVRLLAWSSVAQAGYMLAPLAVLSGSSVLESRDAFVATLAYLLIYSIVNLSAFAVVSVVGGGRRDTLDSYAGLSRREPVAAAALAFALLCLAGLPPGVVGLFAKLVVFQAIVNSGTGWLALVMAANVAIGLAYYLRWLVMVFWPSADVEPTNLPNGAGVAITTTLTLAVVFSVWPAGILTILSS
jgi:NADH-quinone oxidoreductase subunit N